MKQIVLGMVSVLMVISSLNAEVPEKVKGILLKTGAHW